MAAFANVPTLRRLGAGSRVVVHEWERLVLFHNGTAVDTLLPGAHRRWQRHLTFRRVDMRPWILQLPTQEVPTSDGVSVKITVTAVVTVADPVTFVVASQAPTEAVYLAVQVALRDVVSALSVEQLLHERASLAARLAESISGIADVGMAVQRAEVKDIILPSELKHAQAEVLLARAQGQAAIEKARSETAALRGMVNAARLAAEHPELLQLRLLQELSSSSGNTVIIDGGMAVRLQPKVKE